jgi:predicted glycoside hydrolase/deacetylase ChbG (UPF0249 family)
MKSLIINADDVGFSSAINEAARICYQEGRITGVSVTACGTRFLEAAEMLRGIEKKDVGVHLTLTGDLSPCAQDKSGVSTLIGRDGKFMNGYKSFASRYFLGKIDPAQVYLELSSQIKKVQDEGLTVTHLDSHEHVHMFPEILEATIKLAGEFNVPYIRLPLEPSRIMRKSFSVGDFMRHFSLVLFTPGGKKRVTQANIKYNRTFLGHFHAGRINYDVFCFLLDNLREGINELAVHPAVSSEDFSKKYPWYKNAEGEFSFLTKENWKKRIASSGIRLASHKDVA